MTAPVLGRDFRLLWSAAVSSRFGDSLRTPALALLAATLTRDPRAIAAVTVAGQLPPLLLGLLGGAYADRWDRRRTMAAVDGLRAGVVAALAVLVATGRAGVAALAAAALLLATLGTVFDAASFAVLPSLVAPAALPTANGRLQAGTAVAGGFLGAPLAGVLFALSAALPFTLDALTFAAAALLTLSLPPARVPRSCSCGGDKPAGDRQKVNHNCKIGGRSGGVWREAWEGVRWVRRDRVLWGITLLTAGSNLAISGLMAVLVLYALEVLRVPAAGYGLFAAGAVVGGLVGALAAGRLAGRFGTVPALRGVLAVQTLALTGFALARHPLPGGLALACFAAGTTIWNSLWASYGQRQVPAELLGRVGAAQRVVGRASAPIGAAVVGFAGQAYGVAPVGWAAAAIFAVVTVGAWRTLRAAAPEPTAAPPTPVGTAGRPALRPRR
ncbi:MFS-type transporter involved in bile tolerance, Atg22 family [Micromonospora rhizosphaerae]|uniref:MFS-type transporter involved in bile tolerance, Atg22 family n=1 Tax=Micromonospora rhizosphaerae TaxID=568872 RepID=A0A1C6RG08_9ACTN|nr:MFS transporter [Micromonospora rhizosphaerae]SCL16098.1 MFS-type transporter involved in bile tolerance, Atg22 family [Micromonospora rhizosphaerae]